MTDLISLDCYKAYKDIKSTGRDGKLQNLITQVSALIENYCNRKFIDYSSSPGITEWFDAKTSEVDLTHFPVIAVAGVTTSVDGGITQLALTEASSNYDGYYIDLQNCRILEQKGLNFLDSYDIPYRSLEITYTAGYSQDGIPEDLKLAVQDLVHYYEENESKPTQTLLGGTRDNPLPYTANSFPAHIRRILDLYRYSAS
jgi:hypothetical protein